MKLKIILLSFTSSMLAVITGLWAYNTYFLKPEIIYPPQQIPIRQVSQQFSHKIEVTFNFTRAAEKSVPAVVHIMTTVDKDKYLKSNPLLDYFFGDNSNFQIPILGAGSGVIISTDGYIVTNNHVVANFDKIEVIFNDKRKFRAQIIGRDLGTDLALLKINANHLPAIQFANSDSVKVGQWVLAVGNPFNLTSTVTAGIVSAKAREINLLKDKNAVEAFIQTDAAVNPGNSGGALVNPLGELIGINTAIASKTGSYAGYAFAIPSNLVKKIIDDLKKYGYVQRASLGITVKDITSDLVQKYQINTLKGAFVEKIENGSLASDDGLQKNDIIVEANGKTVSKAAEFMEYLNLLHPGDTMKLKVLRENQYLFLNIKLKNESGNARMGKNIRINSLGAEFSNLSKENIETGEIDFGIKVEEVFDGKFQKAGIPQGLFITKFNGKEIHSVQEFKKQIENYKGGVYLEGILPSGEKAYYAFGLK